MLKVWMKTGFKPWKLPPFTMEEVLAITEGIVERDAFVQMEEWKGSGSIGKYLFYDAGKDVLFVFRFPVSGYLNVYVHIKKANGKFGQYEEDGIKVATITTSHINPHENMVRYYINGWWVGYLNQLFRYLIEEKQRENTGKAPAPQFKHIRKLEHEAVQSRKHIAELM